MIISAANKLLSQPAEYRSFYILRTTLHTSVTQVFNDIMQQVADNLAF